MERIVITDKMLREACGEQRRLFRKTWPHGARHQAQNLAATDLKNFPEVKTYGPFCNMVNRKCTPKELLDFMKKDKNEF